MTPRAERIDNFITSHRKDFLQLLRVLVEEETPSDVPEAFEKLFHILQQEFNELGMQTKHLEGNHSAGQLLVTPQGFDATLPIQLIIGHCDTVWDQGTLAEMPFEHKNNIISGPGIYDMKAGVSMMIIALRAIQATGESLNVQPVILLTTDEEVGSEESRAALTEWSQRAERTFVLEPALGTDGKVKTRRKGVGDFEITVKGKPSHAGLAPEQGVSAILGLSHIVQQLFDMNDPSRGISVNVGTIEGGERSNVIAAQSKAVVDVRILNKADGERITEQIYNLKPDLEGIELLIEGEVYRPPMEKNPQTQRLWEMTRQLGDELDLNLQEGLSGGASDGNFTSQYSPTIDGLGAVGEGAHAWHEKIFLEPTLKRTALFALLLLEPSIRT